jgi:hypothetical protein
MSAGVAGLRPAAGAEPDTRTGPVIGAGPVIGVGPDQPRTVRDLLFPPGGDTPGDLGRRMWSADAGRKLERVLDALPRESRAAVVQATGEQAAGLLGTDLAGLLVSGWRAQRDLAAAACRTLAATAVEVVALATHEITATQQPSVTVLADGQPIAVFRFGLSVRLEVHGLVAEVSGGRLTALHAGRGVSQVTLTMPGSTVAEQSGPFAIPGLVAAGPGIRLLPARDYQVSAATTLDALPTASTAAGSPAGSRTAPIAG